MARRLWTSLALWLPGNPEVQDNKHLTDPSHGTWGKSFVSQNHSYKGS